MKKQTFKQFLLEDATNMKHPLAIFHEPFMDLGYRCASYISDLPITITHQQFVQLCKISFDELISQYAEHEILRRTSSTEYTLDIKTKPTSNKYKYEDGDYNDENVDDVLYHASNNAKISTWKQFVAIVIDQYQHALSLEGMADEME